MKGKNKPQQNPLANRKTRPGRNGGTLLAEAGPGRPRLTDLEREVAEESRREIAAAVQAGLPRIRGIVNAALTRAEKGDFVLFDRVMDRVIGKVKDRHELSGPDGGPMVSVLTDQEVGKLFAIIKSRTKLSRPKDS